MSKVGYTVIRSGEERKKLLRAGVKQIIEKNPDQTEVESFKAFLKDNQEHQIVVVSIASIGKSLAVISLLENLVYIRNNKITFHVIDQGLDIRVNDRLFLELLINFAEIDKSASRERTLIGLEKAKLNGKIGGRPKIASEVSAKIKYQYVSEKKTIREIAENCGVSIGTAYKYAKLV